jgi:hypothetical protein
MGGIPRDDMATLCGLEAYLNANDREEEGYIEDRQEHETRGMEDDGEERKSE